MRRLLAVPAPAAAALILCTVSLAAASSTVPTARPHAQIPLAANLGQEPPTAIRDRVLPWRGRSPQAARLPAAFGGVYTAATGESVTVLLSDGYPPDPAANQAWADLLASLVHGSELATVTLYVAPIDEVRSICGENAYACYDPNAQRINVPGEQLADGTKTEEIAAHEYGHHIAFNRDNAPWAAYDWGPKRWATYLGTCARVAAGTAFPGDEGAHYALNPGEGWAEAYRRLNETRVSNWGVVPWGLVDQSFFPDETTLGLVDEDVRSPWTGPTAQTWTGKFRRKGQRLVRRISAPLDGNVTVSLVAARRSAVRLFSAGTTQPLAASQKRFTYTDCGQRSLELAVTAGAKGPFAVRILTP